VDTVRAHGRIGQTHATNLIQKYSYSADEFLRRVRRGPVPAARQPQRSSPRQFWPRRQFVGGADANHCSAKKSATPYGVGTIIGVERRR